MRPLPEFRLLTPADAREAVRMLRERAGHAKVLGGGTRLLSEMRQSGNAPTFLVDLSDASELAFRYRGSRRFHLGPLVRLSDLAAWDILWRDARALAQACAAVFPLAVRNQATLGGNLLQMPPAGDCATALCALDARLRVRHAKGERDVSLDRVWDGRGRLSLAPDEIVCDIGFNPADARTESAFAKLGRRTAVQPADAVLAARIALSPSGQVVHELRLAAQVEGHAPARAPGAEKQAVGARVSEAALAHWAEAWAREAAQAAGSAEAAHRIAPVARSLLSEAVARLHGRSAGARPQETTPQRVPAGAAA